MPVRQPLGVLDGGQEEALRAISDFLTAMPEKRLPIISFTLGGDKRRGTLVIALPHGGLEMLRLGVRSNFRQHVRIWREKPNHHRDIF